MNLYNFFFKGKKLNALYHVDLQVKKLPFFNIMSIIFPLMRSVRYSRKLQAFSRVLHRPTGNFAAFGTYMRVCAVDD